MQLPCYGLSQKRHFLLMLSHALEGEVSIIMFPCLASIILVGDLTAKLFSFLSLLYRLLSN